jgi:ATP-binding cassette subfamily B protein
MLKASFFINSFLMTKPPLSQNFFAFLLSFLGSYKKVCFVYILCAISAGCWGPFNALLMKYLMNTLQQSHPDPQVLLQLCTLIVLNFLVFDNVTWRTIGYIRYRYLPGLLVKIDKRLLEHLLAQSTQFNKEPFAGKLAKQISELITGIEKVIASCVPNFLRLIALLLFSLTLMSGLNAVFFLILLVFFSCGLLSVIMKKYDNFRNHRRGIVVNQ